MEEKAQAIIDECRRQEESCNYTATATFSWLKEVRIYRVAFITVPIVCGALASAKILLNEPSYIWLTGVAALLAGLFPAIFKALDLDVNLKTVSDSANRFVALRDRFRQIALIDKGLPVEELEKAFKQLMERMDDARAASLAVPERHFKKAQKKIEAGHTTFAVDTPHA